MWYVVIVVTRVPTFIEQHLQLTTKLNCNGWNRTISRHLDTYSHDGFGFPDALHYVTLQNLERIEGLEPPRLSALVPKTSVATITPYPHGGSREI